MKRHRLFVLLLLGLTAALKADDFTVDWHQVGHGGGSGEAGEFSIRGIIGQPLATAPSMADEFEVTGGFGVVVALPTVDAPPLAVGIGEQNTIRIYWPMPSTGWELRQGRSPDGPVWEKTEETVVQDGTHRFVVITPNAGARFYRLFRLDGQGGSGSAPR